jgi:predicted transcriptional regulator
MRVANHSDLLEGTEEQTGETGVLRELEESCKSCHPLTPLACITSCRIWKLKNEFRKLSERVKDPSFTMNLLNTLKNERRLQVMELLSRGRNSVPTLQQELKKMGFYHSQQTIFEEYLGPMIEVGLATEDRNQYYTTLLGCSLSELIKNHHEIVGVLPPHSECYEETVLSWLLNTPKTYEEFESMVPTKSVARVLNRLEKRQLIETTKENDYIFYFKTKRDSNKEAFSLTEKRVYENVSLDGISARRLAAKTGISLRRTYKYLRRLKGKKLVFTRKKPKSYALTTKGVEVASLLKKILELPNEKLAAGAITGKGKLELSTPNICQTNNDKEGKAAVLLPKNLNL